MDLRPMVGRKAHVGEHVGLGLVREGRELDSLDLSWSAILTPLGLGGVGAADRRRWPERRNDAPAALAGMGERVAHGVDPAALPGRGLFSLATAALMPSWASEMTSWTP
jgi:hypothetical protein